MKIKIKKQPNSSACGPTVLQLVTQYFKNPVSFSEICKLTKFRRIEGLSNNDIVSGLKKFGYSVTVKKNATWEELKKLNIPDAVLIVAWMMDGFVGHVSLIEKVTDTHVTLADTDEGTYVKMPKIKFLRLWMSYDDKWFPEKNTDIDLRWVAIVKKKTTRSM